MIDEELTSPEAFSLAVRARASYLARQTLYEWDNLRPYSQLSLLLGIELETTDLLLRKYGLRGAYRAIVSHGQPPLIRASVSLEPDAATAE